MSAIVKAFNEGFNEKLQELSKENEVLKGLLGGFTVESIQKLKSDLDELKSENATLRGENSVYKAHVDKVEEIIKQAEADKYNKLQVDYNKLKGVNNSLRADIRSLSEQLSRYEVRARLYNEQKQEIEIKNLEIADNRKEIDLLNKSLQLSEKIISVLSGVDLKVDKIIEKLSNSLTGENGENGFNVDDEIFNDIMDMLQAYKSTIIKSTKNKMVIKVTPEEIEKNLGIARDLVEDQLKQKVIAEKYGMTPQNLISKKKTLANQQILDLMRDHIAGKSLEDLRVEYSHLEEYIEYLK